MVQTITFVWVYFTQMTRQLLTMKTFPKCEYINTTLIASSLGERGVMNATSMITNILNPTIYDMNQMTPIEDLCLRLMRRRKTHSTL